MLLTDMNTAHSLPDSKIFLKIKDITSSNGMLAENQKLPWKFPEVSTAYGLNESLKAPSINVAGWAEYLADVAFRIPPYHIALQSPGNNVYIYELRCTNPYPNCSSIFNRANHAVNDLFVFDVAPDQVPEDLRKQHQCHVDQIRAAWLDFCYGKEPWAPFEKESDRLGPVFVFEKAKAGMVCGELKDAVNGSCVSRWKCILGK